MVLYHFDRSSALKEGQVLQLTSIVHPVLQIPLSNFGKNICSSGHSTGNSRIITDLQSFVSSLNTHNLEIHAERIRKAKYPNYPSRLSVLFAVKQLSDLFSWRNIFQFDGNSRICEIDYTGVLYEFDAWYLRGKAINDLFEPFSTFEIFHQIQMQRFLNNYWKGSISESPMMEVLVPLPVTISRCRALNSYPEYHSYLQSMTMSEN